MKLHNLKVLIVLLLVCILPCPAYAESDHMKTTSNKHLLHITADQGAITLTPSGIRCESDCSYHYTDKTVVTLSASAKPGFTFIGWSESHCGEKETCTFTVSGIKTVKATFSKNMYNLSVILPPANTGSGSVSTSSPDIQCGADCSEAYEHGTIVTLRATADQGSAFFGWSGDCTGVSICRVTMDAVKDVRAIFVSKAPPVLASGMHKTVQ